MRAPLALRSCGTVFLYLIDTSNVTRDLTNDVNHMYDMVADVLFEDFGGSEFSSRKRSISVNTEQYKLVNYLPAMSERHGPQSLSYSCAYSSFGQTTIVTKGRAAVDTAIVTICKGMIQSLSNVALQQSNRLPSPEDRNTFVNETFLLSATSFEETILGVEGEVINEPVLVGDLLKSANGKVDSDLLAQVHRRYQEEVLGSGDVRNWHTLARRVFDESGDDVAGSLKRNDEDDGSAGMIVRANRRRMLDAVKSPLDPACEPSCSTIWTIRRGAAWISRSRSFRTARSG